MKKKKVPEKAMLYQKMFKELSSGSLSGSLAAVIGYLTQMQVLAEMKVTLT